ncbi:hypothetical protein COOONC_26932, partial [Cooperia oncophora]
MPEVPPGWPHYMKMFQRLRPPQDLVHGLHLPRYPSARVRPRAGSVPITGTTRSPLPSPPRKFATVHPLPTADEALPLQTLTVSMEQLSVAGPPALDSIPLPPYDPPPPPPPPKGLPSLMDLEILPPPPPPPVLPSRGAPTRGSRGAPIRGGTSRGSPRTRGTSRGRGSTTARPASSRPSSSHQTSPSPSQARPSSSRQARTSSSHPQASDPSPARRARSPRSVDQRQDRGKRPRPLSALPLPQVNTSQLPRDTPDNYTNYLCRHHPWARFINPRPVHKLRNPPFIVVNKLSTELYRHLPDSGYLSVRFNKSLFPQVTLRDDRPPAEIPFLELQHLEDTIAFRSRSQQTISDLLAG